MSKEKTSKRMAGGSAAERGLDFQARASAIVMAHLLVEQPLGWLEGILDDTPRELHAETGGPGDDISFSVEGGEVIEIQAKRGLQRGNHLWDSLMSLSRVSGWARHIDRCRFRIAIASGVAAIRQCDCSCVMAVLSVRP